jgi:hypothetical protein
MKSLLWIAGLYVPFLGVMTAMTGHLSHLGDASLLFYPFGDGPGYTKLGDYYTSSFGLARRPAELFLEVTPFLYPLYLGLYRVTGVTGVQLLQVLMNVVSLWCVYVSVMSLTSRSTIAALCTVILAVTPSFSILAFYVPLYGVPCRSLSARTANESVYGNVHHDAPRVYQADRAICFNCARYVRRYFVDKRSPEEDMATGCILVTGSLPVGHLVYDDRLSGSCISRGDGVC